MNLESPEERYLRNQIGELRTELAAALAANQRLEKERDEALRKAYQPPTTALHMKLDRAKEDIRCFESVIKSIAMWLKIEPASEAGPNWIYDAIKELQTERDRLMAALKVATDALKPYARMGYPRAQAALTQIEKELKP